ncbi:Sec-independent protein translocase protein TATA, chloroplastic [Linum perenne]
MEISLSISRPSPVAFRIPSSSSSVSFKTASFSNNSGALYMGGRRRIHRAKRGMTCNALFGLGVPELVVIAGVAALVFGPKKLPEVGKSIGKTVKSFQQAAKEFESELKKEPDTLEETPAEKPVATSEENQKQQQQDLEVSSSKESV